jgi:hypothetical protein
MTDVTGGKGTMYFPMNFDIENVTEIGIYSLWGAPSGTEIRIKRLEVFAYLCEWDFFCFDSYIDFEFDDCFTLGGRVEYSVASYIAEAAPWGVLIGNRAWPNVGEDWSATFSDDEYEEQGLVMKIKGREEQILGFEMCLPYDKTFGDVEKISFKYKFVSEEDYADYAMVVVHRMYEPSNQSYYNQLYWSRYPAVYYSGVPGSYTDGSTGKTTGEFDEGYGRWATFTMETAWFDLELGKFDNARFSAGDGYMPDLESLRYETRIWLGVGFATWGNYYMDDIMLIFKDCDTPGAKCFCELNPEHEECDDTSVQTVKASSVKVYSIAGGIAIEGVESAAIYGIDGSMIATAKGEVTLPKGVYIVKAGDRVVKAVVK